MKEYHFRSSRNPNTVYTTTEHDNGVVQCNCPAFKQCWHIRRVLEGGIIEFKVTMEDRRSLRALLDEGNEEGAIKMMHDLFPSISEEETTETVNELMAENVADWNDKEM